MPTSITKRTDERGARARENRRFTQGVVVAVNQIDHTCDLDVGEIDQAGNAVVWQNRPFSPQSPPSVGDTVAISYASGSPHSAFIPAGRLSGTNSQGSVTSVGGVSSLAAPADTSGAKGDIKLVAGAGAVITRSGQNITIAAAGGAPSTTTPADVASAGAIGADTSHFALADHAHKGVHSVAASGQPTLAGDVVLAAGSGVTLTQSGQNISIAAAAAAGVSSFNTLTGAVGVTGSELLSVLPNSGQNVVLRARRWIYVELYRAQGGGSGVSTFQFVVPYGIDGTTSVTWNFVRMNLRVTAVVATGVSASVQKSAGGAAFSGTNIASPVVLTATQFEGSTTTFTTGSCSSGDLLAGNLINYTPTSGALSLMLSMVEV